MNEPDDVGKPLLDEDFLARCSRLALISRSVVRGKLRGEKRSRRRGMSTEFADHRDYVPGDDLRHLDWNIYGRLEKLFIKLFEEEEERNVVLLLDASRSMGCGEPNKWRHARQVTAAIGAIALASGDRVHLRIFDNELHPVSGSFRGTRSILQMVRQLEQLESVNTTALLPSLRAHAANAPPRALQVLISDLMDPKGIDEALRQIAGNHGESWLIHLLSQTETDPQFEGDLRLSDIENRTHVDVSFSSKVLEAYRAVLASFREDVRTICGRYRIQPVEVSTAVPFDQVVLEMLRQRRLLG
ncbi:MAG: DUF58 domain-containing protein [Planctomycetota bacterium]